MAEPNQPYRRLPGTGYRRIVSGWVIFLSFFVIGIFALLLRGRRVQLWQGEDHLLLVENDGYRENYKRFHYRDIQAFIIRKTTEGKIVNIAVGLLAGLFIGWALSVEELVWRIFLLCVAGVLGLIVVINGLAGPTCECSLRTGVQMEVLPSLDRLKRARKVIGRLRPHIAAAQGQLSPGEIPLRMQQLSQPASATTTAAASTTVPTAAVEDPGAPPPAVA